jgi:hypothetical protein
MTQGELAAYVDTHLKERGIDVVLSGGASVAIYSNHTCVSKDLDFIAQFSIDPDEIEDVMEEIGFNRKGKHFYHPKTLFFVDFIPGPLSVGDGPVEEICEIEMDTGSVRIISATDSVKDRLAGYYYWQDMQSLEQALLVARNNPIDMKSVETWSKKVGKSAEFDEFKQLFTS